MIWNEIAFNIYLLTSIWKYVYEKIIYEAENIYEFPYMIYEKIMPTKTEFF